jgi:ABC-type multidrug transport system fused ATPase/permease subunit
LYNKLIYLLPFKQQKKLLKITILLVIGVIFEMLGVGIILPILTLVINKDSLNNNSFLSKYKFLISEYNEKNILIFGFLFLLIFYLVKFFFTVYLNKLQSKFIYDVSKNLSSKLYRGYIYMDYDKFLEHNTSNLIHIIIGEVAMFATVCQSIMILLTELSIIIGVAAILIYIEPKGSLIVIAFMSSMAYIFYRVTKKRLIKSGDERQYFDQQLNKNLLQSLHGIKDVKIYNRQNYFVDIFNDYLNKRTKVNTYYNTLQQFPRPYLELLSILGITILVSIMSFQNKSLVIIISTVAVFITAAFRMIPSLNRIMSSTQNIKYANSVVNALYNELKNLNYHIKNTDLQINQTLDFKKITITNISFQYINNKNFGLKDISITIEKGELIGIIGESGSGKSTFVDILMGLLIIQKGEILINNKNNLYDNLSLWRSNIGYVPQNIYLIDESIKRNIAFGIPDSEICPEKLLNALKLSQLDGFISNLHNGVETMVGDRGVKLSGGQRQRIGIARALYNNPTILILDEATSALDINTENEVMESINSLRGQLTMIIIAHRLTTVKKCDIIYQFRKGEIINKGKPEDIL